MMRNDFAAFILTNRRPKSVLTFDTLRRFKYTGRVYLIVDDEDPTLEEYRSVYGDKVLVFSKDSVAEQQDMVDNFEPKNTVLYARNASFDIAREIGVRYFMQLDDDYTGLYFRFDKRRRYGARRAECLDEILSAMIAYFETIPAVTICMSQGGDHMGGATNGPFVHNIIPLRKAMNTFLCSVDRPFKFTGRMNDDVNTYVMAARAGELMLTIPSIQINQRQTQLSEGGLTDMYRSFGTYVKSFYTVVCAPSCARVGELGSSHRRLHHKIDWPCTAVQIVSEKLRKT